MRWDSCRSACPARVGVRENMATEDWDNSIEQSIEFSSQMYKNLCRNVILPPRKCALEAATKRTSGRLKERRKQHFTSCLNIKQQLSTLKASNVTRTKINRIATTSTSSIHLNPSNTKPAFKDTSSLVIMRRLSSSSSSPILIGLILFALTQPNGTLCKGLVGKLPGNPASCPEEPCTSDPQHVLYALKWTSLGFGIILLLPLLMYYLSKLISKINSMCSNKREEAKQADEKEHQEQKQGSGSTRSNRSATSGGGGGGGGKASKHGSEPASMASSASSSASAAGASSSLASATTKEPSAEMNRQQQQHQHKLENKKSLGLGEEGGNHDRRRKSTLIENNLEREARHSMVQHQHLYQRNLEASQRRSSALPTFDKFQLEENMQLNQDLEQRNRQLVRMIADSNAIIQQRANDNDSNNNTDQERGSGKRKQQQQHRYSMIAAHQEHRMSNQFQQNQNEAKRSTSNMDHRNSLRARPGSSRRLMQQQQQHHHHHHQHQIYPEQLGATGLQEQQDHHGRNPWIGANTNTASSPPSSSNSATNQYAANDGKLSLVGHLYQQQQQQHHDQNTLALPANGGQHRHSIDGSILNNMVHGMQQGREQVDSVSSSSDTKHHHHHHQHQQQPQQEQRVSYSPNATSGGAGSSSPDAGHRPGSRKKQQQQHLAYQQQQQQHYLNNTSNHNSDHNHHHHQLLTAGEPNRDRRPSLNETPSIVN